MASTMDGYFLYDKQLVCRVLKFGEIHPNLFDGAEHKFRKVNWHGLYRQKRNADRCVNKTQHFSHLLFVWTRVQELRLCNVEMLSKL